MRNSFAFTMITKTRPWRHIYNDIGTPRQKKHNIEIPRPKNHDIEIQRPRNHDIEISRPKNHDIEIPKPKNHNTEIRGLKHQDMEKRRQIRATISWFQGVFSKDKKPRHQNSKTKKPRHRDSKTKKSRHWVPVEFWPLCPLISNWHYLLI